MVGELQLQGPVGWMRTRREKRDGKKKEVQVEGRDERREEGQLAGRGAAIRISRYEVRGTRVLAETTPANEVARTLHRGLVPVLSWQRCRRYATKRPGVKEAATRYKYLDLAALIVWQAAMAERHRGSSGRAALDGLGGIATWGAPALTTLIDRGLE